MIWKQTFDVIAIPATKYTVKAVIVNQKRNAINSVWSWIFPFRSNKYPIKPRVINVNKNVTIFKNFNPSLV